MISALARYPFHYIGKFHRDKSDFAGPGDMNGVVVTPRGVILFSGEEEMPLRAHYEQAGRHVHAVDMFFGCIRPSKDTKTA